MPKRISEQEPDAIVAVVAARPEGTQVGDILEGLPAELEKRTLQRRLAWLVEHKRLIAEGKGKGRRYRVAVAAAGSRATVAVQSQGRGQVLPAGQARFVEVVETELMSLHEGNIARYRLRPSEFQRWRQGWR